MRKSLLFLFTAFLTTSLFSQSYIKVIRASSHYANAVINYTDGNYKSALVNLEKSEKNLEGKTNRDLEYLKIMSNYHLERYKQAYTLTKTYFENDLSGRKRSFKNVTTYKELHNIDYEEKLTILFVDIEDKSNLDKSTLLEKTSSNELIPKIVAKIKNRKTTLSSYMNNLIVANSTEKIDYCLRETSKGVLKRIYENNFLTIKKTPSSKNTSYYFIGTINGTAINTSKYKFEVSFAKTKTDLTSNHYSYGYQQKNVKHIEGNISLTKVVYQCNSLTAPKHKSSDFSNLLINRFKRKSFVKTGHKTKLYKIHFTDLESAFLKKGDNLSKLHIALKNKNLL